MSQGPARGELRASAGGRDMLAGNLLAMTSMLAWAAGFPAAELLLATWPPLTLITARLGLAVALLLALWLLIEGPRRVLDARWGRGTLVGGLSFGLGAYLLLQAQALTDPVTVALIAALSPLAATLLEAAQRSRRLTRRFLAGLGASILGGLVAARALEPAGIGPGAVLAGLSVLLFAWGSMAAVRDFPDVSPLGRSTITLAGGLLLTGVLLLATQLAGHDMSPRARVDAGQITVLALYALAGMALSQLLWIASVGRLGVALASFHLNVAPFFVMLIMAGLGAGWSWTQALGATIVAGGLVLAQDR